MGVSNLRRSNRVDNNWERLLSSLETPNISIQSIEEQEVQAKCDDYPFESQSIFRGGMLYRERSEITEGRDIEIDYEYRTESGLLVIKSQIDLPIEAIIKEINSVAPKKFHIYRSITPSRENLWKFISSSDRVLEITFLNEEGRETPVDEFEGFELSEIVDKYPINTATAVYEYEGRQVLVRYTGGSIVVDTEDSEANEYIIQLFERDIIRGICNN